MTTETVALLALTLSLSAHFAATVWWAATLTKRIDHVERWISQHEHTAERLAAMEQKMHHLASSMLRIERHILKRGE